MGISLAPDPTLAPTDPTKPKAPPTPGAPGAAPLGLAPATPPVAPTGAAAPLPTEYPSAPSTTGTPQNRLQLATTAFDTFAKSTAPQYTADLRQATQAAAGKGQIGSGGLRTTYGDLANQRALALDTERSNLINAATTGTIADQQAATSNAIGLENADTSRIGTVGNLDVAKGNLGLATTAQADQNALGVAGITGAYTAPGGTTATPTLSTTQLKIDQQNADTASAAQKATAANEAGQLGLATKQTDQANAIATAGLTGILNGTATLQAKTDAVNQAVAQGQLSVAQGQLALSQLANTQQNTLATAGLTGQLQTGVDADGNPIVGQTLAAQQADIQNKVALGQLTVEQGKLALAQLSNSQQIGLATAAQDVQSKVALGQLSIAQASQALDEKVKTGELTVEQAKQALDEINSTAANKVAQQNANTAQAGQQATATNQAGTLQLAKDQLAQAGTQFGLSQAQNLKLATLADATQNRQIDVSTAQGQNALLLQLANIIGGPAGSLDPAFVQTIMKALGISGPTSSAGTTGGSGTAGTGTLGGNGSGGGTSGNGGGVGGGNGGNPLIPSTTGDAPATQLTLAPDPNAPTRTLLGDPSAFYQPQGGVGLV